MSDFSRKQSFSPQKIFVEQAVAGAPFTERVLAKFPQVERQEIEDANALLGAAAITWEKESWRGAMLLAKQRGPFLRLCPGTQKHLCCLYHNLDVAAGCDLGCTYCVLQGYLNNPLITFYANTGDMYAELEDKLAKHARQFFRIGTGELTDSLTFDHITEMGPELVEFFAGKQNAIIELKSKNVHIDKLLNARHNGRAVISWSMNADAVYKSEEGIAAGLDERLQAAIEVQKAGYKIGFHFDPMIDFPGWQEGYRETVDKIFRVIKPADIAWISLGALRYPAPFDDVIRENHPGSKIYLGELLPGVDKKMRYFRPIRVAMFRSMCEWIRAYSPEVFVYLCMENKQVWRQSFGWAPRSSAHLKRLLDDRVME